MTRKTIHTPKAPKAIGPYSQAIAAGGAVYLSGQIGLDPASGELVKGGIEAEARRVFTNLAAVAEASGASLAAAVKVTIYLVDFGHFAVVNGIMQEFFREPYPARVTIAAAGLPRGAAIEVDCILVP
jgi:reactive intermediate/imine deaminase